MLSTACRRPFFKTNRFSRWLSSAVLVTFVRHPSQSPLRPLLVFSEICICPAGTVLANALGVRTRCPLVLILEYFVCVFLLRCFQSWSCSLCRSIVTATTNRTVFCPLSRRISRFQNCLACFCLVLRDVRYRRPLFFVATPVFPLAYALLTVALPLQRSRLPCLGPYFNALHVFYFRFFVFLLSENAVLTICRSARSRRRKSSASSILSLSIELFCCYFSGLFCRYLWPLVRCTRLFFNLPFSYCCVPAHSCNQLPRLLLPNLRHTCGGSTILRGHVPSLLYTCSSPAFEFCSSSFI